MAANVIMLSGHGGSYYPILFLFGLPMLFGGLVGLLFPAAVSEIVPAPGAPPLPPLWERQLSRGALAIVAAGAFGAVLGGYMVYDPTVILRWIGLE